MTCALPLLAAVLAVVTNGWTVAPWKGSPGLFRAGRPVAPFIFWQWEPDEVDSKAMAAAGVSLFAEFGSFGHYRFPYWQKDGFKGLPYQEEHLDNLLRWAPDAAFAPRLFDAAPQWWIDSHPAEQVRYTNKNVVPPDYEYLSGSIPRESMASELCRKELGAVYAQAVRRLFSRYGEKLFAVHVAGGPWAEHFSWDALTFRREPGKDPLATYGYSDASAPMTRAFRAYLRGKYRSVSALRDAWQDASVTFETAAVPTMAERLAMNEDGCWRDPAKGRKVPDYFECHHAVTVDHLCHYADIVRRETGGRVPALAFYGYTQDISYPVEAAHAGISKLLRRDSAQILSAPHSYRRRRPGEDGLTRAYLASVALHGKLFIDEGDDFTYLALRKEEVDPRCTASNAFLSVNLLYREFGNAVTHGVGLWYMDLDRGAFRAPELVEAVARMRLAADRALRSDHASASEVAVVSHPESDFYRAYKHSPGNTETDYLNAVQIGEFCRAGAPFDWYLADDLPAVEARSEIKVLALLDCQYLTDDQVASIERLRHRGVRIVAFHAPGLVSQTRLDWNRLPETRAYRKLVPKSADELRAIYREAGVHLYVDRDVVLSANASWVMLHAKDPGTYRITLPTRVARVTDVASGRVMADDSDTLSVNLAYGQTAVLHLEREIK